MINKKGTADGKTISTHDPKTGATTHFCTCAASSTEQMTKQAFVKQSSPRVCKECGK